MITIVFDTPILRGSETLPQVQLRKPAAGELRGLNLTDLLQMEVTALQTVLPRITLPTLTKADVAGMDPADLLQLATEVAGFLLPKAARPEAFSPSA